MHSGQIAGQIEHRFRVSAISTKVKKSHRKDGRLVVLEKDMLPGYIFLCSETQLATSYYKLLATPGVYRILGREEDGYCLMDSDKVFAEQLFRAGGIIDKQYVCREGELVALRSELFKGMQGTVKKYERRNGRALIEFDFAGARRSVWVAVELIER